MSLEAFAQHLAGAKAAIMERWQAAVCRDSVPSARGLPRPRLWDHLPAILDDVVLVVERGSTPAVEADGEEHGRQRWAAGYEISEVLRELTVLRDVLQEVTAEYAEGAPGLDREEERVACRRLQDVIDRTAEAALTQYFTETLAVRQLLEQELRVASEQKDRFLATLSHELRNPLAPILTAVQFLELTEGADPRLRQAREIIERQVRHQTRLVDDLLDLNRVAQGKIALHLEACDLRSAVERAIERCLPGITIREQVLEQDLPADPVWVRADPVRLEQIVSNLLVNATRYTPPGGTIRLSIGRDGEEALLRVKDTGQGIAPDLLPRIFDLFVQADLTAGRGEGGLGIGLTLVRHLVELHGGRVEAFSAGPDAGSEFTVRLALTTAPVAVASSCLVSERKVTRPRRIAIVEDNADGRAVLAELLELVGHTVVTAADGAEALRLAREHPPEVFVVDIGLPDIDGYQVARALREAPETVGALLIALSGYGSADDTRRAREAGFDAHLTKPADIQELLALLDPESADHGR